MFKKKINLALIAARKNSKGVKNKNLLKIKKKTITKIAVKLALKSKKIGFVILSSDGQKILDSVKDEKKLLKINIRKNLAKDTTPMLPVMKDAIEYFEKKNRYKYMVKNLIIFDPTSPLSTLKDINSSIKLFEKEKT